MLVSLKEVARFCLNISSNPQSLVPRASTHLVLNAQFVGHHRDELAVGKRINNT